MWTEEVPDIRPRDKERLERHCGMEACLCTHGDPCFMGWVDAVDGSTTSPCPICREDLARVLKEISPVGERTLADQSKLRQRGKKHVRDDY